MPDGLTVSLAVAAAVLALAALLGRGRVRGGWLAGAGALLLAHDLLVTNAYRALPDLIGGALNWQGKLLALAGTLAAAALLGRRRAGLALAQEPGSPKPALLVAAAYLLGIGLLALVLPNGPVTGEELAFQLTLPGAEEELFYRGVLLLALDRALPSRARLFGVDWGWGAVLTSLAFGLDHALSLGRGGWGLDPIVLAMTGLPSLVAAWLRYRTGSLVLPAAVHNAGNILALYV